MAEDLVLYDIPQANQDRAWSPNTLKARYALRLKRVPFRTIWVEFTDIEDICKKIGATPTGVWPDGRAMYTLPVLQDPRNNTVISDSYAIAEYLDATYTNTPPLIPSGTAGLHAALLSAVTQTAFMPMTQVFLPLIPGLLSPSSAAYYRRTREQMLNLENLDDFCPANKRGEMLDNVRRNFSIVAGWYAKSGPGPQEFLMGGTHACWADVVVAAFLTATKWIFGEQSDEWRFIQTWDGQRWERMLTAFEMLGVDE
ncbi:hypothetical protein NEOLEDRAFT_1089152 [Neolentinus lepideus HHB14362 ss-1]|uniref:GST N-terminal domain-containing protein n=1 Tax=Neolentinus lepideus HHB14362 ss-1 TaxID=1314782 RepID=A0A165U129_9AGAM|nr:hypothetical protein NEOLEDRAFT_1089152 [Neolentinus lepideus HHB14362 ss-1]